MDFIYDTSVLLLQSVSKKAAVGKRLLVLIAQLVSSMRFPRPFRSCNISMLLA